MQLTRGGRKMARSYGRLISSNKNDTKTNTILQLFIKDVSFSALDTSVESL